MDILRHVARGGKFVFHITRNVYKLIIGSFWKWKGSDFNAFVLECNAMQSHI